MRLVDALGDAQLGFVEMREPLLERRDVLGALFARPLELADDALEFPVSAL